MDKIIARLKELRLENDYSQEEVANHLFITQGAYAHYEGGRSQPPLKIIAKLATLYNVSIDYLMAITDNRQPLKDPILKATKKIIKVPILGTIAAGVPIEAIQNIEDYEDVIVPKSEDEKSYFCIRVKGNSMEPRIKNGDLIICKKQNDVDTGDIAAVLINGHEATVKKIKKDENGIWLIPNNPMFETRFFSNNEISSYPVTILGKVVELRGKF